VVSTQIALERQRVYGWLITIDTFLGGTGSGAFLISFILALLNRNEPITKIGTLLGPLLVLSGTFFLLADISSKARVYRIVANPLSWMSRGTLILAAFVIFGLAYSLPSFALSGWTESNLGKGIGIIAAIFAVLVSVYPGFLFGRVKRIPFWSVANLPLLFFLSSCCCGIAILLLIGPLATSALGESSLQQLRIAGILLIAGQLLVLGTLLETARHGSIATAESSRLLKTPMFIIGVIIAGTVVPLGLLSYSVIISNVIITNVSTSIASLLLLIGGLLLRQGIIRAGVYLPLQ